jgi:3-isopropylmalate dehydrogenase
MKLLLLPGDGIGPEVTAQSRRVAEWLTQSGIVSLELNEAPIGGAAFERTGSPLPPETMAAALAADAVLMGSVGGPAFDRAPYALRPEAGLLDLRRGMNVFANLRPAFCFPALVQASTLRPEIVAGIDILFVRELTGGVYFGEPRGIEILPSGERRGVNTHSYTETEIRRVARIAFEIARTRRGELCSVDKANVMDAGRLWREVVTELHSEFKDVTLSHMLADNCAMQLVRRPAQFDVILTDNLFGDILSDTAAMLTGSIGMLPSGAIGEPGRPGLYEPIHGSAPDIAGKNIANPLASILSLAMALRYSLEAPAVADGIERAVGRLLEGGAATADIGGRLGTAEVGDALLNHLAEDIDLV